MAGGFFLTSNALSLNAVKHKEGGFQSNLARLHLTARIPS